jgi:hypothetical protein
MGKWKVGLNKQVNIGRVVTKIVVTILSMYVGGALLTSIGAVVNQQCSQMYGGLTIIGWTVGTCTNATPYNVSGGCWGTALVDGGCRSNPNTVLSVAGNGGLLVIVAIIGIASLTLEFVNVKMG